MTQQLGRARSVRGVPRFAGELITPGSRRYDRARRVWNAAVDRYPALIARAHSTTDVVAVVRYAREEGLALSVRGGGHSTAGLAVADGALMLDLSAMTTVHVSAPARVAVAAPGLAWGELDAANQAHGLATTGATVGSVGVAGMTLGGGTGRLDRLVGLNPVLAVRHELEVPAEQRMKPVRHPHTPVAIIRTGCSRRWRPMPSRSGSRAHCAASARMANFGTGQE
jgi:FAD/FMN-containing dehydrogenase